LTYDIAVEPQYEPWRVWIDEQLSYLPLAAANFERRLWLDESHRPSIIELAADYGSTKSRPGLSFEERTRGSRDERIRDVR